MRQKRLLSIQDISCTGRCSLTVALPIISAGGIETVVLPTAILSTHTGGFKGYTFRDLTADIPAIEKHWETLDRGFDAIYTGYLAPKQIDLVTDLLNRFRKKDTLVLVDPAMADGGEMYPGFDLAFAAHMASLVAKADITVPNLTEACFLLGKEYRKDYDEGFIRETLKGLASLGPRYAVISGISFNPGKVGVYSYDSRKDEYDYFATKDIPGYYHGAGDIFASGLIAGLMNGIAIFPAVRLAHDLVHESILKTLEDDERDYRFGLHFERALPFFIKEVEDRKSGKLVGSFFD